MIAIMPWIYFTVGVLAFLISGYASWDAIDALRTRGWNRAYPEAIPWGMIAAFFLLIAWHAFKIAFAS